MAPRDLRAIFDQDAELYDRARPRYPTRLVDDLAELAEIGPGARVVEIGPGTGQATAALAARGAHLVGVELGPELAAVLRRELADASLEVVVSAFEDWPLPDEPFDTLAVRLGSRVVPRQAGSTPIRAAASGLSEGTYGYRRVHAQLAYQGERVCPELVRELMRELGLVSCQPRPYPVAECRRGSLRGVWAVQRGKWAWGGGEEISPASPVLPPPTPRAPSSL